MHNPHQTPTPRGAARLSESAAGHLLALTAGRPMPHLGPDATPAARAAVLALMYARGVTVGATALDPVPVRHRHR